MKKILLKLSIIIVVVFINNSCSGVKTDIIGEWQDDSFEKGTIDKVLVLGIVNKEKPLLRRKFENGMSEAFINSGYQATASMDIMPYDEEIKEGILEKYASELDLDAVVVSRLVGVEKDRKVETGYLYTVPYTNYYGFYGYYYASLSYANSSGYLSKNVVVVLETNIYETKDKKLIWSGISETLDPDKASDVISSFGETLVAKLKENGILR